MKQLHEWRLYTFVDTAFLHGRDPADIARQLCAGGSDVIQLRAKNASPEEVQRLAERILPVTRGAGVPLVINDYPQVAQAVGAEVCHLGQEDFFDEGYTRTEQVFAARASASLTGGKSVPLLGLSSHAPAEAERALAAGAAYIAIGPVYATGTKPTARPVTLEYVHWAATHVRLPWFAIGGINEQTLDTVLDAGARRICIVSAILNAPDIARACQQFKERIVSRPL